MKIFYIVENYSRELFISAQAISKKYNVVPYGFSHSQIIPVINEYKPDFLLMSNEVYKSKIKELDSQLKNFCTKIILIDYDGKKTKKFKTISISSTDFALYNEYFQPQKIYQKDSYWFGDLSKDESLNEKFVPYIYPNNKNNIVRLVGYETNHFEQNVGIATEEDILELIYGCEVFINVTNKYLCDAIHMKKPVLNLLDNETEPKIMEYPSKPSISEVLGQCLKI